MLHWRRRLPYLCWLQFQIAMRLALQGNILVNESFLYQGSSTRSSRRPSDCPLVTCRRNDSLAIAWARALGLQISGMVLVVGETSHMLYPHPSSRGLSSSGRSSNADRRSGVGTPSDGDRRYSQRLSCELLKPTKIPTTVTPSAAA